MREAEVAALLLYLTTVAMEHYSYSRLNRKQAMWLNDKMKEKWPIHRTAGSLMVLPRADRTVNTLYTADCVWVCVCTCECVFLRGYMWISQCVLSCPLHARTVCVTENISECTASVRLCMRVCVCVWDCACVLETTCECRFVVFGCFCVSLCAYVCVWVQVWHYWWVCICLGIWECVKATKAKLNLTTSHHIPVVCMSCGVCGMCFISRAASRARLQLQYSIAASLVQGWAVSSRSLRLWLPLHMATESLRCLPRPLPVWKAIVWNV